MGAAKPHSGPLLKIFMQAWWLDYSLQHLPPTGRPKPEDVPSSLPPSNTVPGYVELPLGPQQLHTHVRRRHCLLLTPAQPPQLKTPPCGNCPTFPSWVNLPQEHGLNFLLFWWKEIICNRMCISITHLSKPYSGFPYTVKLGYASFCLKSRVQRQWAIFTVLW